MDRMKYTCFDGYDDAVGSDSSDYVSQIILQPSNKSCSHSSTNETLRSTQFKYGCG